MPEDLSLLGHDAVLLGEKHLHLKSSSPFFLQDGTPKLRPLWYLSDDTASRPRRLESAARLLLEPEISEITYSHQQTQPVMITPESYKWENCAVHSAFCLLCTCICTYLTKASVILSSIYVRIFISFDSNSSQRWGMWLGLLHFLQPASEMTLTHHTRIMVTIHTKRLTVL